MLGGYAEIWSRASPQWSRRRQQFDSTGQDRSSLSSTLSRTLPTLGQALPIILFGRLLPSCPSMPLAADPWTYQVVRRGHLAGPNRSTGTQSRTRTDTTRCRPPEWWVSTERSQESCLCRRHATCCLLPPVPVLQGKLNGANVILRDPAAGHSSCPIPQQGILGSRQGQPQRACMGGRLRHESGGRRVADEPCSNWRRGGKRGGP